MSVLEAKVCTKCGLSKASSGFHKRSLSKGGTHTLENLKPACDKCNGRKNDAWPFTDEMKETLANEVRNLTKFEEVMP